MSAKKTIIVGLMLMASSPLFNSCKNGDSSKTSQTSLKQDMADKAAEENSKKIDELNEEYPKIPDDKILDNGENTPLYTELKKRYKDDATKLKQQIEATGAKVVFILLSPDVGKTAVNTNKYGMPAIRSILSELNIDYVDMSPIIAKKDVKEITQVPKDGHWSKYGASYIADNLAPVIKKYSTATSTVTYKDSERPETFGDLAPNDDEILDGGKDMPYHVQANAQGLRMDHNVVFPKKKKHILLMGDSAFFCPFLNNEFTITANLQKQFPDFDIMNNAIINYTLEDYVTLWNEKAKYSEPDLVLIQTNGSDLTDYFFTHRNHLSRSHKPFYPTPVEEKYYKDNFAR